MLSPSDFTASMLSLLRNGCSSPLRSLDVFPQSLRLFFLSRRARGLTTEEYREWHKQKALADPEWAERRRTLWRELKRRKWFGNPDHRENQRNVMKNRSTTPEHKALHQLRLWLHCWCSRKVWVREQLPWKTHTPVWYPQRIELHCTGCARARASGARLYWQAHDDGHYLCQACYSRRGRVDAMPTGYEDCTNLKEIAARKQQLDGIDTRKLT